MAQDEAGRAAQSYIGTEIARNQQRAPRLVVQSVLPTRSLRRAVIVQAPRAVAAEPTQWVDTQHFLLAITEGGPELQGGRLSLVFDPRRPRWPRSAPNSSVVPAGPSSRPIRRRRSGPGVGSARIGHNALVIGPVPSPRAIPAIAVVSAADRPATGLKEMIRVSV